MPLKDDVAKYYAQGKEAVTGYVEAYKDKDKHRKEDKEHEKDEKAAQDESHVIDDKASATPAASTSATTGSHDTDIVRAEEARPSSALAKYKDRLAIKLPTGQFDIGKSLPAYTITPRHTQLT